jgi:hypothetical protein
MKIESRLAGTRVPFGLPVFTLATRPSLAAGDVGRQIYVADAPPGQRIQVWVGTGWEAPGGGSPGGNDRQLQYNNSGIFDGAAQATINESGQIVIGASGLQLAARTSDAPASASGQITLYARFRSGHIIPQFVNPFGQSSDIQPAIFSNRIAIWVPGSGTALGSFGLTPATTATLSHPALATTSLAESIYRTRFTTATSAGSASGVRDNVNTFWRGMGFFHHVLFATGSISLAGGQKCVGLSSQTAILSGQPSALPNLIGMIKDQGDTNWFFARRNGTGTVQLVDLGVPVANNQVFSMTLFSARNGTGLGVQIVQHNFDGTSTVLLDATYNTDLPAQNTLLGRHFVVRNGSTAAADNLDLIRWYSEAMY